MVGADELFEARDKSDSGLHKPCNVMAEASSDRGLGSVSAWSWPRHCKGILGGVGCVTGVEVGNIHSEFPKNKPWRFQ